MAKHVTMFKLYYLLTAYIPRKLPTTPLEYAQLKDILVDYYGVPNDAAAWITVAGQITSTQANKLRKSYGAIANAAKRLEINKLASEQKAVEMARFQDKLEKELKAYVEAEKANEEAESGGEVLEVVQVIPCDDSVH